MLTEKDLHTDPVTVRRIRRIQKSRNAEANGLVSSPPRESAPVRATSVDSDSGEDIDAVERRTQRTQVVKKEPPSKRVASQVVDLGEDSQVTEDEESE